MGPVTRKSTHGAAVYVPIPLVQLNRLRLKQDVRQFFLDGGLRFNKEGDTGIWLRSDTKSTTNLLEAIPLQDAQGELLADARRRLDQDNLGRDLDVRRLIKSQVDMGLRPPSALTELQVELLLSPDPVATLNEAAHRSSLSLWTIRSSEILRRRLFILLIFDYLRAGGDAAEFLKRPKVRTPVVSGLVELQPASMICSVLAARNQPLVAVLLTPFLSQVVLVPKGGTFLREPSMLPWPVAYSHISFTGSDPAAYHTPVRTLPDGHGKAALEAVVVGGSRLLDHLTKPEMWTDDEEKFDFDRRLLAWSSIRFGLDAITALAADWTSHEAIWTAFRAITILQGIWDCQLSELLDPKRIEADALPVLFDATERSLAAGILANYRRTLDSAFPGRSSGTIALKLAQIRHLVHGMRTEGKDPFARLDVLRSVEAAGPSLELLRDVATLWWTAVLLSPETHGRPGQAPWVRRGKSKESSNRV